MNWDKLCEVVIVDQHGTDSDSVFPSGVVELFVRYMLLLGDVMPDIMS